MLYLNILLILVAAVLVLLSLWNSAKARQFASKDFDDSKHGFWFVLILPESDHLFSHEGKIYHKRSKAFAIAFAIWVFISLCFINVVYSR